MATAENLESLPLSWITKGAFALAIAAFVLSGIMIIQGRKAQNDSDRLSGALEAQNKLLAAIQASHDETAELNRLNSLQIGHLTNRVNALQSASRQAGLAGYSAKAAQSSSNDSASQETVATKPQTSTEPRRFTAIPSPQKGVEIWQNEDGSIQAKNDDPALTGKIMVVEVEDESGNMHYVTITAPAPEG